MGMHNNGKHIELIVGQTVCTTHRANKGDACWPIDLSAPVGRKGLAVCGSRIKLYGFNGRISAQSIQTRGERNSRPPVPR